MPEPENPKPPTTPEESTATQPPQAKFCHIHDKVEDWEVDEISENVCVSLEEAKEYGLNEHLTEFEGNHYCLFHLPKKEKDTAKFEEIFQARLERTDQQCADIEAEFPDDEEKQNEAKEERNINYDFRYVWFPSALNFFERKFSADAYFSSATFSADADFSSSTFGAGASFSSATFSADADFSSSTFGAGAYFGSVAFSAGAYFGSAAFSADASFRSAAFSAEADFSSAAFSAVADFSSAAFSAGAYFGSAAFSADADFGSAAFSAVAYFGSAAFSADASFRSATFDEKSQIYFLETRFCSIINFKKAEVSGYIEFEGDIFCNAEKVKEIRTELKLPIEENQEAVLEFQEIRLRNPERVSFNSTKLRPNWFVNVAEARKLEFNDVEWRNSEIDIDRTGLEKEIESLRERRVSRAERSLIKACNQLADNAEANRRFEEAKRFRKQSIALQNYECHVGDGIDEEEKERIRANVCKGYSVVNEDSGNYFCLLHNPDKNKAKIFLDHYQEQRKWGITDFRGVVFPISLRFDGELPEKLDFSYAVFQREIRFHEAKINKLDFYKARFEKDSEFIIEYSECKEKIVLDKAILDGKIFINGKSNHDFFGKPVRALSMEDARIEKPQNINFKSIRLRPHYFVGVDASKFTLHDCVWTETSIVEELKCCSHKDLAQTSNQIAINYEENRHFEESSFFRYLAMETKRTEKKGWRRIFNLYSFYKLTSSYGENWRRAAFILLGVLIFFGIFYYSPFATFDYGEKKIEFTNDAVEKQIYEIAAENERFHSMNISEGMVHSLYVAALQRPEPKAVGFWTKLLIILQTILAPLQAALLALAIRRKFMR